MLWAIIAVVRLSIVVPARVSNAVASLFFAIVQDWVLRRAATMTSTYFRQVQGGTRNYTTSMNNKGMDNHETKEGAKGSATHRNLHNARAMQSCKNRRSSTLSFLKYLTRINRIKRRSKINLFFICLLIAVKERNKVIN